MQTKGVCFRLGKEFWFYLFIFFNAYKIKTQLIERLQTLLILLLTTMAISCESKIHFSDRSRVYVDTDTLTADRHSCGACTGSHTKSAQVSRLGIMSLYRHNKQSQTMPPPTPLPIGPHAQFLLTLVIVVSFVDRLSCALNLILMRICFAVLFQLVL